MFDLNNLNKISAFFFQSMSFRMDASFSFVGGKHTLTYLFIEHRYQENRRLWWYIDLIFFFFLREPAHRQIFRELNQRPEVVRISALILLFNRTRFQVFHSSGLKVDEILTGDILFLDYLYESRSVIMELVNLGYIVCSSLCESSLVWIRHSTAISY